MGRNNLPHNEAIWAIRGNLLWATKLLSYLRGPIEVGKPVVIDRTSRNGVEVSGLFESSPVVAILDGGFETENSVYQLEVVEGRSPDLG
jgi:hypothetical protein